ncbi:MAG: glycosyltransferase, partial [Planctomycetota bacterium]
SGSSGRCSSPPPVSATSSGKAPCSGSTTVYRESKGLPAIEALAAGTPVVLPEHGAFPELVAETGGGLLHRPEDPLHLAERLAELLCGPELATRHGMAGRDAVHTQRTSARMAEQTIALYRRLTAA